ncbi:MAG: methyltransferase domain-containing protein [Candidatus Peribacteraceae bacterium]|nr:methyltransferase domain-containing protein [Candidatus Peribacteraceae bacterium]
MIELQRKLLGDRVRNAAFEKALKQVIVPEKTTIVDLGSGTGFLSFLASRLGAKHCTLIEYGDILEVSQKDAVRNGITNCTFIKRHSTDVRTMEPVDLLVSETLGNYALEENIIESVEDAKRFLKPKGIIIPGSIRQYVCPVIGNRLAKEIDCWDTGHDLDLSEARTIAMNNMYVKTIRAEELWNGNDAIREWDTVDFKNENGSIRTGTERWTMEKPTTIHGFGLWWEAELIPGITLSTSHLEKPTHWEQIYLPLLEPLQLKKGQSCELRLHSDSRFEVKINLTWEARTIDASGKTVATQKMDMRRGYLS